MGRFEELQRLIAGRDANTNGEQEEEKKPRSRLAEIQRFINNPKTSPASSRTDDDLDGWSFADKEVATTTIPKPKTAPKAPVEDVYGGLPGMGDGELPPDIPDRIEQPAPLPKRNRPVRGSDEEYFQATGERHPGYGGEDVSGATVLNTEEDRIEAAKQFDDKTKKILLRAEAEQRAMSRDLWPDMPDKHKLSILNHELKESGLEPVDELPEPKGFAQAAADALEPNNMPFLGSGFELVDTLRLKRAFERQEKGESNSGDERLIAEFQAKQAEAQRGHTFMGGVANIAGHSAPFAVEFMASGGLAAAGRATAKEVIEGSAEYGLKQLGKSAIKGTGKLAIESGKRLPVFTPRIAPDVVRRQIEGDDFWEALGKSTLDMYVEVFSEGTGGSIGAIGRYAKGTRAGKIAVEKLGPLKNEIMEGMKKSLGWDLNTFTNRLGKFGYHGVIGEMAEEDFGRIARGAIDKVAPGWGEPLKWPTLEERAQEALAFSVPGTVNAAANFAKRKSQEIREEREARDYRPTKSEILTPEGVEWIVNKHPSQSAELMKAEKPGRSAMEGVEVEGAKLNANERSELASMIRERFNIELPAQQAEEPESPEPLTEQEQRDRDFEEENAGEPDPVTQQEVEAPKPKKKKRSKARKGVNKAENALIDIDRNNDWISEQDADQFDQIEGEETRREGYSFKNDAQGRSHAKELKDRLPKQLHTKVKLTNDVADGSDVMADIGTDAMAESMISHASKGKKPTLERVANAVENNPERFTPEEVYAVKRWRAISASPESAADANKAEPEKIDTDELSVGDMMEIAGEPHEVTDIDPDTGGVTVEDGVEMTFPGPTDLIVDKGSVIKAPENEQDVFVATETPGIPKDLMGDPLTDKTGQGQLLGDIDIEKKSPKKEAVSTEDADLERIRRKFDETATEALPGLETVVPKAKKEAPQEEATDFLFGANAEAIQEQADAEVASAEFMASGVVPPSARRKKFRRDEVPSSVQADEADFEEALVTSHSKGAEMLREARSPVTKVKDAFRHAKEVVTRANDHVPNTKQFAAFNEALRLLKQDISTSEDEVIRTIAAIIDPVGPKQFAVYERKVVADNLEQAMSVGGLKRFGAKNVAQVRRYREKVDKAVDQIPEVQQALKNRRTIVREIVQQQVDRGMLPEDVLENVDTYFHQRVHEFQQAGNFAKAKGIRRSTRAFQKSRVNVQDLLDAGVTQEQLDEHRPELDYSTNYIESEAAWMIDAMVEIKKDNWMKKIGSIYDIHSELVAEAAEKSTEEEPVNWESLIPDTHAIWYPKPGNVFFLANTISDKLAETIITEGVLPGEVDESQIKEMLAVGGKRKPMVLPTEIVDQLESMVKPKPRGALSKLNRSVMKAWKVYTLMNPERLVGYMARNLTGDIDPVLAVAPGAIPYAAKASKDLWDYYISGKLSMPKDVRLARDLAVIGSSLTAEEIPDAASMEVFDQFFKQKLDIKKMPWDLAKKYFKEARKWNEWREDILRLAAFRYYRDKLKNGTLKHYGGAKKSVVEGIQEDLGQDYAAAHLARNLMGDYGNLTVMGDYLRDQWIPFWSWQEINIKRTAHIIANQYKVGDYKRMPLALGQAAFRTILQARLGTLYAMQWVWNNLFFGDEEEELSPEEQASPHVITGRDSTGGVNYLSNAGAMGDILEWLGINSMIANYDDYEAGQISLKDLLESTYKDPLNKAAQSIRPDIKGVAEILTGKSLYPSVLEPRSVDRAEAFTSIFGLTDEYRWLRGKITADGSRVRKGYGKKFLGQRTAHRQQTDLHRMHDLRDKFRKMQGKPVAQGWGVASPTRNMRYAAMQDDYKAFVESMDHYKSKGKTFDNFKRSLNYVDPIKGRLSDEDERKFDAFLTAEQRLTMRRSRDYAKKIEVRMWQWWRIHEKELTDPKSLENKAQMSLQIARMGSALSDPRPVKKVKQAEWKRKIDEAERWIKERGLTTDDVLRDFHPFAAKEWKDPKTRNRRKRMIRKRMASILE